MNISREAYDNKAAALTTILHARYRCNLMHRVQLLFYTFRCRISIGGIHYAKQRGIAIDEGFAREGLKQRECRYYINTQCYSNSVIDPGFIEETTRGCQHAWCSSEGQEEEGSPSKSGWPNSEILS